MMGFTQTCQLCGVTSCGERLSKDFFHKLRACLLSCSNNNNHCVEWVWSDTLLHPFYPATLFIKKVKMTPFLALHPLYCINFALHPFYFHTGF